MKLIALRGAEDTVMFINPTHIVVFHDAEHNDFGDVCLIMLTGGRKLYVKKTADEITSMLEGLYHDPLLCSEP